MNSTYDLYFLHDEEHEQTLFENSDEDEDDNNI